MVSRKLSYRIGARANARQNSAYCTRRVPDAPFAATRRRPPIRLVYASTTGVYGDCGGALIDETRPVRPENARAKRRVSAETRNCGARPCAAAGACPSCGFRAFTPRNRLPLARIERGTPALVADEDVFTNHIHADDLAAILVRAILRAKPQRAIHASDDTDLLMGDYFDRVADA